MRYLSLVYCVCVVDFCTFMRHTKAFSQPYIIIIFCQLPLATFLHHSLYTYMHKKWLGVALPIMDSWFQIYMYISAPHKLLCIFGFMIIG